MLTSFVSLFNQGINYHTSASSSPIEVRIFFITIGAIAAISRAIRWRMAEGILTATSIVVLLLSCFACLNPHHPIQHRRHGFRCEAPEIGDGEVKSIWVSEEAVAAIIEIQHKSVWAIHLNIGLTLAWLVPSPACLSWRGWQWAMWKGKNLLSYMHCHSSIMRESGWILHFPS